MIFFILINILIFTFLSILFSNFSIFIIGLLGLSITLITGKLSGFRAYKNLIFIFMISVIVMLVMYFGYSIQYGTPYFDGGSDDLAFEINAKYLLDNNYILPEQVVQDVKLKYHNSIGFLWIISWIMRISDLFGGYHTISFRLLNIFFLLSLSILVFRIFVKKYQFSYQQNKIVLFSIALFPNMQYISLHVFRDLLSVFILFIIFYIWDINPNRKIIFKRNILIKIVITFILFYIAYWIRYENVIIMASILLISLIIKSRTLSLKNTGIFLLALLLGVILIDRFNLFDTIMAFNERYTIHKSDLSDGFSNKIFSLPIFPIGIMVRIFYALISPIPVNILQIQEIFKDIKLFLNFIVSLGVIIQIYMLPYLFKNFRRIDKFLLSFLILLLGITVTTFTFRHFIMLYPFMVILIYRQFFITPKRERYMYVVFMTILLAIFACIYILIK